jgi:eukaryotic-like serine/threonine-protein kinase
VEVKVDVARVASSGATDLEPARAFLQDRIGLWAFWVFVLSFGFYVTNIVTWPFMRQASARFADTMLEAGSVDHLAASLVFGGVWVLSRRVRVSMQALRVLDVGTLIVGCTLFALMGAYLTRLQRAAGLDAAVGAYAGLLACANTVLARAITVPSTPRRTLLGSLAAMAPLIPATFAASRGSGAVTMNVATWCVVSIAVATVGSRVIFGLRTEAARVRRLGQYTLENRIGAGGMGVVYRARHAMLRRPTAIKLLRPDRAGDASLVRFEREVQLTAELSHPNTVAIYDYGRTPEGIFYYAMEYLDGINLEDLVRQHGAQPAGRVLAILDQVCGALAEAHGRGLVHRDIKPANIILSERGGEPDVAKVVDFGLVQPLGVEDSRSTLSATNVLTGTPLYMSPEAMMTPAASDPRSDLYALGAVAYYLLSGCPVFEGTTVVDIIAQHLQAEPVPPSVRLGRPLPSDLEAVVARCLRKVPSERPESARALRDALGRCGMVQPWTSDEAATWWRRFRAAGPRSGHRADNEDACIMSVDVAERLTHTAFPHESVATR